MTRTFTTAEEATGVLYELIKQLNQLPYNPDLLRLYSNIKRMVEELSKLEVYTRRTLPQSQYHAKYKKLKNEILRSIAYLEKLVLLARIMA